MGLRAGLDEIGKLFGPLPNKVKNIIMDFGSGQGGGIKHNRHLGSF